jgi:predicted dehydrogenase
MRVAIIGASHWHLPLYLEPLLEVPGAKVVGVSDPSQAVVAALSQRLDCVGDVDFRALCRRVKPDFVLALGRHVDMPDQARFLIAERIPFALEKPCGLNQQDVAELARLAEQAGAFAAVPLVIRNGDFYQTLRAFRGTDGFQYMTWRFIAGFPSRYLEAGCDWMLDPALSGGGCTMNLAPHFFDLCHLLLGPDAQVRDATMSNAAFGFPVEDYSVVTLGRGRDLCVVETGYLYPAPTSTFDMHFALRSPARYIVAHGPETVEIVDASGKREMRKLLTTNVPHYRTFVFDVLERMRSGAAPLASLSDMVPVMRIVDDAYAMARRRPLS